MPCFRSKKSKSSPTKSQPIFEDHIQPENRNVRHEVLLSIPGCKAHLMDAGEAIELASGVFELVRLSDENVSLATIVKIGDELQWPLTKDEPVVKLDAFHYLFSLPMKDGDPLSYGVTFSGQDCSNGSLLGFLDSFLCEHALLTSSATSSSRNKNIDWKEFAPRIDDYNSVLAKAIAGGTGQIVKGIFKCSNGYTNQIHKGGEKILVNGGNGVPESGSKQNKDPASKKNAINKTLKRVRKLSKMTEKMSKAMLDGVGIATGSVMGPMVKSQAGKAFFTMLPGEVLLASLDAVNKIIDAAEAAEKQSLSATSGAVKRMVSERFGENAGEATEDVMATAGHCAGFAWNIFKIRKAINPASSVSAGALKNVPKTKY